MTDHFTFLQQAVRVVVALCWLALGTALLLRRRSPVAPKRTRDPVSMVGIGLQAAGTAMTFLLRRRPLTSFIPLDAPLEILLVVVTIALAVGSTWLMLATTRTLGKHWSLTTRLMEGHKLLTGGPFRVVRHPMYTAGFGMVLANGLALSYSSALLAALVVYWIGTAIRIRSEEKVLRETFGEEFEAYARRVPGLFPRLRRDS